MATPQKEKRRFTQATARRCRRQGCWRSPGFHAPRELQLLNKVGAAVGGWFFFSAVFNIFFKLKFYARNAKRCAVRALSFPARPLAMPVFCMLCVQLFL
jgi:hypothetical protein